LSFSDGFNKQPLQRLPVILHRVSEPSIGALRSSMQSTREINKCVEVIEQRCGPPEPQHTGLCLEGIPDALVRQAMMAP
jgi:hypothetical protein